MAIAQVVAGARILISDLNAYYSLLKGSAGEAITLIYNATGSVIFQPSSDPAAATEAVQIKNNAGTVQSALSYDGRVYAADGAVGTPGHAYELDKDTGIYRTGSGAQSVTSNGVVVSPLAIMVQSGASHAPGFAPDPPASSGTTKFLREDATWAAPSGGLTIATEQATTSGTSIDFTGIPSGTKLIYVMLKDVSTNGTSRYILQLGDSGGIETTSYVGVTSATAIQWSTLTGISLHGTAPSAANSHQAVITLTLENASTNLWLASVSLASDGGNIVAQGAGYKATSATLDRVRLTTSNGTDTFDAGVVSISYQ